MNESIALLKQMLRIYSPSGHEGKISQFLEDRFRKLGFKNVRLDEVGNVHGEIGVGRPTFLLCGHIDTVPGHLSVKMEENKIYGRGAVDAKSSISAMIMAASELSSQEISGSVKVIGAVDEEGEGRGVRQLIQGPLDVDYAIFGEPSGIKNITRGYKGKIDVKILCETEPGHSSAPHIYNNAIEEAYKLWSEIKAITLKKKPRSIYYSTTACLTNIQGGGVSGVIPSKCELDVEVRMPPSSSVQKIIDLLKGITQSFKDKKPDVRLEMMIGDKVEPFIAQKDSPLIRALTQAIKEIVGGPVKLLRKSGTGDMNIFATKMKIPVVTYGPGNAHLSHTLNEFIDINEYLASIKIYQRAIMKLIQ